MLEQQVSLASARAAYDRLTAAVDPLTPQGFLALDDARPPAPTLACSSPAAISLLACGVLAL
ncbi:hypothetical protein [Actinoplanes sp. NPDC049599]|uniref:hypothetical protein n=1 Tax=Actinoplanes sp. NPDC049599 TaxID=3363903 RepID=UPI0037AA192C